MTKYQNGILIFDLLCCYRALPEPLPQEAQENLELPPQTAVVSETEDPAEINLVTFSPLHLLQ